MSVAIGPSRLPSLPLIIIGDVMEAPDVFGRINQTKTLAEPPCGSADILHTLQYVAIDH